MLVKGVMTVLMVSLLSAGASAAKLYKIVDENGKVTFSQFPPKEKSANTVVEDVNVKGGGKEAVRLVGTSAYCGDMYLGDTSVRSGDRYAEQRTKRLAERQQDWQQDLQYLEQRSQERAREKLSEGGGYNISRTAERNAEYQRDLDKNTQRMRELRCAVSWAQDEMAGKQAVVAESKGESDRLRDVHAELETKMLANCGLEPRLDPTDSGNAKARRQWCACTKEYRKGLDQVEGQLNYR